ncbi:phage head-tail joining protein [Escherichia coli]|nr:phage head-tail joining protein [Escherichia coli]
MVTVAELQALRQARLDLLTGKRVVSVQKDGRRIEYTAASLDELNRAINDAESVLGTTRRRRRPLGVRFEPPRESWRLNSLRKR